MLVDPYGRKIDYVRLSVTDRCNLNCIYCSPKEIEWQRRGEILSYEEMTLLIQVASSLGITRFRFTGGEPLVRRDFTDFVSGLTTLAGVVDLSLTTNGILLSRFAQELHGAGLNRVNISLDSLKRDKYRKIAGKDALGSVLEGIDVALEVGFHPVKINVVLLKGLNDDEVDSFAELALSKPLTVRFIEFMPAGLADWDMSRLVPNRLVFEDFREKYGEPEREKSIGGGPAVEYSFAGMTGKVAFISSVSEPACAQCNRLRVTALGRLRPCLFSEKEFDLKCALRGSSPEQDVERVILEAVRSKPRGHFLPDSSEQEKRPMAQIGG